MHSEKYTAQNDKIDSKPEQLMDDNLRESDKDNKDKSAKKTPHGKDNSKNQESKGNKADMPSNSKNQGEAIGEALKSVYQNTLDEDIPDQLLDLLNQLK